MQSAIDTAARGSATTAKEHFHIQRWSKQGTENAPSIARSANDDDNKAFGDEDKIQGGNLEIQPRMQPDNTSIQPQQTENDCCWKVKVAFTTNHLNGAYKLHKYIFGYYTQGSGLINGKPHYTSVHGNGAFAMAFCGDSWWLQGSEVRGECKGWAHSGWRTDKCVHNIDYSWRYFIPVIDEFVEANKGLSIWCKS